MSTHEPSLARLRTRWSAIGAAIAITLGAGGIGLAQAAVDSGDKPITVTVDSKRILDTRSNLGLAGAFAKDTPRNVQVTGSVAVATATGTAMETVVPAGASAVLVNVTVVTPTDVGFLTLRSGAATGAPSTSTVNFAAPGGVEPNSATVDLSADGKIQVWVFMPSATARADVLIDVVGYTIDHNHDDRYHTKAQVNAAVAAAVAPKANSADVYTKTQTDAAVAPKANSTDVYTKTEVDALLSPFTNSVAAFASDSSLDSVSTTDTIFQTVTLLPPADGVVVVNSQAHTEPASGILVRCSITTGTTIDFNHLQIVAVDGYQTISGTRAFTVTAGNALTVNLVCDTFNGAAQIADRVLTAIYAPS